MEECIKEKFCEKFKEGEKESFNKELNRVPENLGLLSDDVNRINISQ
jgi:hypothetical protein